jgi:hypothetical protein
MRILTCLAALFLLMLFPLTVSAGGFYLTKIGAMDVEGTAYPKYWYSGNNVTFVGVAPAGAVVTVSVDGIAASTNADEIGSWSYNTILDDGEHEIVLSTEAVSPYSFTLAINQEIPEGVGGGADPADMPVAGVGSFTVGLLVIGLIPFASLLLLRKARLI